jgi:hypothetical protein
LTDEYIEGAYEQMFYLNYTGNFTLTECYNLPVGLRNWFTERLSRQIKQENEAQREAVSNNSSFKF